jgi:hypothetical protein
MSRTKPIKVDRPEANNGPMSVRLLNLGPKSSQWLADAGISTRTQLASLGPIEACRRVRKHGQPASVLMAYAIEGALTGQHWNELPRETKSWLRSEFARMKQTEA